MKFRSNFAAEFRTVDNITAAAYKIIANMKILSLNKADWKEKELEKK